MKSSMKHLLSGISLLACATAVQAAGSCTPAHKFQTIKAGVLSVAMWNFPPYAIPVNETDAKGVDGDILKLIAAKECLTLSYTDLDSAAVIQSVVSGKADLAMGDWYRTATRAKALGLSAPMYLDQMGIVSKDGLNTIAAMQGKRVGAVQGDLWTPDLQKVFGSSLVVYPNPVAMGQDLAAGRIDAGANSYAGSLYSQKQGGFGLLKITTVKPDPRVPATTEPGQTTLPYAKGNQSLGEALSADIEALRQSGEIARILKNNGLDPSASNVGAPRMIQ